MTAEQSRGPALGSMAVAGQAPDGTGAGEGGSGASSAPRTRRRGRPRWLLFGSVAGAVIVADQLTKAWVVSNVAPGGAIRLIGEELRLVITHNTGGVFGLFRDQAAIFALVSIGVMGLIVAFHGRSPGSRYLSLTLGLLLGGAVGNFIDRVRYGHVIDFVDAGLGSLRFYTFNVADMAVSASVLLLIALSLRSSLAEDGPDDPGDGR